MTWRDDAALDEASGFLALFKTSQSSVVMGFTLNRSASAELITPTRSNAGRDPSASAP